VTANDEATCVPEEFLVHLLHDLKAPVVAIGGFAKRMRDGKMGDVTPEQQEALEVILRSCGRLEHDLKMVLQHMKVNLADRLSPEVFDIVKVVRKVQDALKPEADKKNISLCLQEPGEPVSVEADQSLSTRPFSTWWTTQSGIRMRGDRLR
jgi:signal transduction histidine kinase